MCIRDRINIATPVPGAVSYNVYYSTVSGFTTGYFVAMNILTLTLSSVSGVSTNLVPTVNNTGKLIVAGNATIAGHAFGIGPGTQTTNLAIGADAGAALTTGGINTIVGYIAGRNITTGTNNTILGYSAGNNLITGTNNTYTATSSPGSLSLIHI